MRLLLPRFAACMVAAYVQIYAVALELISMYESYRVPISQEECARLLAVVRPPSAQQPTAAQLPPAGAGGSAAAGAAAGVQQQ